MVAGCIENKSDLISNYDKKVPHIIKYMGSKKNIIDFVIQSINDIYLGGRLCDLFAGTSILSGALGHLIPMHSNDIQEYSSILSKTYLLNHNWSIYNDVFLNMLIHDASVYVSEIKKTFPDLEFSYKPKMTVSEFVKLEKKQQELINKDFSDIKYHLFIKYYSGTYWSFEQCLWIDALRKVADDYKDSTIYYVILSSLMYSMSYNSQSTGHFAQYRTARNKTSQNDILIYRQREILTYFISKFNQLKSHLQGNPFDHRVTSLDYRACLEQIEPETLVYADPPYAFVHYSRFYHALETLVKYDYPTVNYKGRYRSERHQSPFGKKTEVSTAFFDLFTKISEKRCNLILSYSNTGMIPLSEIIRISNEALGAAYEVTYLEEDYMHSTMGRSDDKNKKVKEYLILANRK